MNLPDKLVIAEGFECDTEAVLQAPGRCVRALERINEFKLIMGDISEVVEFVADVEAILKGETRQPWESTIAVVTLEEEDA